MQCWGIRVECVNVTEEKWNKKIISIIVLAYIQLIYTK